MSRQKAMTREGQVILLASEGMTDKQIATELGISVDTVGTYWKRILKRMGAASRTAAVARQIREGHSEEIERLQLEMSRLESEVGQRRIVERQASRMLNRLNALVSHSSQAVLLEGIDRRILHVNEAFCETFRIATPAADLVGMSCVHAIAQSARWFLDPIGLLTRIEEVIRDGRPVAWEVVDMADGTALERDFVPIEGEGGVEGYLWQYREHHGLSGSASRVMADTGLCERLGDMTVYVLKHESCFGSKLDELLGHVGSAIGVDRVYLFQLDPGGETVSNTHEWVGPGISSERLNLQAVPVKVLPWWFEQMRRGHSIAASSLEDLPEEAQSERAHFDSQGIKALYVTPVRSQGRLVGFVGVDQVRVMRVWRRDAISVMRWLAKVIGAMADLGRL